MKPVRDSISRSLPPIKIYQDELSELYFFLMETCSEDITIQTCGYELDTIDDVSNLPTGETNEIHFHCDQPYISIDLTPYSASIYCSDTSIEAEGIVSKISQILFKGKRKLLDMPWWLSILVGIPIVIGILASNWPLIIFGIILMASGLTIVSWEERLKTKMYSTIVFNTRKESPGFWARNKDKIILLIIGSFIGALFTMFFTFLKSYLQGKP